MVFSAEIFLTCIIHEIFALVNDHLQENNLLLAGFDAVLRTLSFDRLRTLSEAEGPEGRIVHEA
jgi:hypothetical protein